MGKITVTKCPIEGLYIIEPTVFGDNRGYFMETYNQQDMVEAGLNMKFVQDNQSMSVKGVLRGLHFQKQYPQGKLVRVIKGRVFDVAVDLRRDSATYGQWHGIAPVYHGSATSPGSEVKSFRRLTFPFASSSTNLFIFLRLNLSIATI